MAKKKDKARNRTSSASLMENKAYSSFEGAVARCLSKMKAIDAVYLLKDAEHDVVHVYSVVNDFASDLYPGLLRQERRMEGDFPEIKFEFHVRAHQGRQAFRAVPFGAQLVFAR
jgi:hypothetical protein